MASLQDVVITGMGIVAPIGVGAEAAWASVEAGRSGVRAVPEIQEAGLPVYIGGDVAQFDPKEYVKPRKSLKVMSR
jgi:3-oxoacyl-[acyl-carrier-protein] synthase II